MPPTPRIVVVGAGVIGLSTAVELQQVLPGTEIQIVAARFSPDLTSDVAAGIWRPYISRFTVPELENQSGYDVTRNVDAPPPPFMAFVRGLRELSREEIDEFGKEYKKGWFYTTYGIQTTVFIRYLTKEFLANGGKFVQRELKSLEELNEDFDIIINCCGLGSRRLLGEEKLYPIRGQVVRVRAPAVKHFFMDDDDYILLNRDFVVLGATHDKGSWDLSVNEETTRSIMERNEKIFPELKYAEILSVHVGLRPFREEIRLEKEIKMTEKGRKVVLIHNYGHGGSGVTLSLGCAEQVGKMVAEAMMGSKL